MVTKNVNIDVSKAVASLARLTQSIKDHNISITTAKNATNDLANAASKTVTKINALRDAITEQIKASNASRAELNRLTKEVQKTSTSFDKLNMVLPTATQRLDTFSTHLRTSNIELNQLVARLANVNINLAQFRHVLSQVEQWTGRVRDGFRTLRTSSAMLENMLDRDSRALAQNTTNLRAFDSEIRRLVGTMKMKNLTVGQQVALMHADAASTQRATKSLFELYFSMRNIVRIGANIIFFGAVYKGIEYLRSAIAESTEWEKRISEIRTISDRAAVSTDQWVAALTNLSNAFGITVLDSAEASYQALSNQVTNATTTLGFLRQEQILSTTAVSSLKSAVDATSSIIQAYGLTSASAASINAVLFKSVELGRFRLQDISETIGRVAILSNQLGVSFVEQQAALSLITKQGVNASEAMTYLRNVEFALIKPTERMKEVLTNWGYTSGETAVQSLGLVEVLRRLSIEAAQGGDKASEFVEMMGRLRSVIGITALTQKNYTEEVNAYMKAQESYLTAYQERMSSIDTRANQQLQRFHNLWMSVGREVLKQIVELLEAWGGAGQVLVNFTSNLGRGIASLVAYRLSVWALKITLGEVTIATRQLTAEERLYNAQMRYANTTRALQVAGLTGLILVIYEAITASTKLRAEMIALGEESKANATKEITTNLLRMQMEFDTKQELMEKSFESELRLTRQRNSVLQRENSLLAKSLAKGWEESAESMKAAIEAPLKELHDRIAAERSAIDKLRTDLEQRRLKNEKDQAKASLDEKIQSIQEQETTTPIQKIEQLMRLRVQLNAQANTAMQANDTETYDNLKDRSKELEKEIKTRIKEVSKETKKEAKDLEREATKDEHHLLEQQARQASFFLGQRVRSGYTRRRGTSQYNPFDLMRRMQGLSWEDVVSGSQGIGADQPELTQVQQRQLENAQKRFNPAIDTTNRLFLRQLELVRNNQDDLIALSKSLDEAANAQIRMGKAIAAAQILQQKATVDRLLPQNIAKDPGVAAAELQKELQTAITAEVRKRNELEKSHSEQVLREAKAREANQLVKEVQFNQLKELLKEIDTAKYSDYTKASPEELKVLVEEFRSNYRNARLKATSLGMTPQQSSIIFAEAQKRAELIDKTIEQRKTELKLAEQTTIETNKQEYFKQTQNERKKRFTDLSTKIGDVLSTAPGTLDPFTQLLGDTKETFNEEVLRSKMARNEQYGSGKAGMSVLRLLDQLKETKQLLQNIKNTDDVTQQVEGVKKLREQLDVVAPLYADFISKHPIKLLGGGVLDTDWSGGTSNENLRTYGQGLGDMRQQLDAILRLTTTPLNVPTPQTVQSQQLNIGPLAQDIQNFSQSLQQATQVLQVLPNMPPVDPYAQLKANWAAANYQALGGTVGSDVLPTYLTRGETVMTAQASRTFAPYLHQMNNQASVTRTNSTQYNFGDIHVSVPTGTAPNQANAVISEIQRRIRLGQLSLRG